MLNRVLVACEFSGIVRNAFAKLGWDAWSCDLLPSEKPGQHFQGDVRDILSVGWDLLIAHPECTYLTNSGVRWLHRDAKRWLKLFEGAAFFREMLNAPVKHVAVENPIMHKYAVELVCQKPNQIIQPWQHGHGETKATCLWLKNLPLLKPTNIVAGREQRIWKLPPGADRWKERSRTFPGIAAAMAKQWSFYLRT